ncbi:MAG TPA: nuclear transport factor 2 family protein [Pyrinomonadaceae bacterium]|jgi:ketosteroid isomerase-like protein|nr:nuclear transport factor 2 family protein [Pyrinomonadaceae bacterium]
MKGLLVTAALIIAASPFASAQMPGKQRFRNTKLEQELKRVEEDWANAYVRHDAAPLKRILADEFITVGSNGQSHGKTQDIEELKSDTATYEYSTPYDLDVRVYGDMAVVIGRTKEKGHYDSGRQFTNEYRWTDIFVKRQGRWQCVAAQVASVPPPKK